MKKDINIGARLAAYRRTRAQQDSNSSASDSSHTRDEVGAAQADSGKPQEVTESQPDTPPSSESKPTAWYILVLKVVLWLLLWGLFIEVEFGAVFVVLSAMYFVYASLKGSRRKSWEPSAYSVFNKDFEAIEGTLTAEQFERELRLGPAAVKK